MFMCDKEVWKRVWYENYEWLEPVIRIGSFILYVLVWLSTGFITNMFFGSGWAVLAVILYPLVSVVPVLYYKAKKNLEKKVKEKLEEEAREAEYQKRRDELAIRESRLNSCFNINP